jgi:predicted flap endonuclease-1-like 5' DNA nuclease
MAFQIDFQSLPVVIAGIFLLLCAAALLGWFFARLIIRRRISKLRELIEEKKFELAQYRTSMEEPAEYTIATNASKTVYPDTSPDHEPDDLKIVEGIGQKIEELLNKEGIHTYEQLSESSIIRIAGILKKAGPRFQIHDPSSWPKQASLAKDKNWDELEKLKIKLISGVA